MTEKSPFDAWWEKAAPDLIATTPARPFRRWSTDRDYRPLWIALVGVATALALLATFQ